MENEASGGGAGPGHAPGKAGEASGFQGQEVGETATAELDQARGLAEVGRRSSGECSICLQRMLHPVELPCQHVFCFLCAKGAALQSQVPRCALCRQDFPRQFLYEPKLLPEEQLPVPEEGAFCWYYEGRTGGWWQYEERSSLELEQKYVNGERSYEVLLAGRLYLVDFGTMMQTRKGEPSLQRRIKRDLASLPCKGVAGIRCKESAAAPDEQQLEEAMRALSLGPINPSEQRMP